MPNWVTNRIVFHGNQENVDRVLQFRQEGEGAVRLK